MNDLMFNNAESLAFITNAVRENNLIQVSVYEWTWIDYQCKASKKIDRMGFATEHIIILKENDKGFKILKDIYDERDITGAYSSDFTSFNEFVDTYNMPLLSEEKETSINEINLLTSSNNYNVLSAVTYADKWVVKDRSSNLMNPQTYNPAYYYYSSDCANYVSQCLYEGGMATDSNWWVINNTTSEVVMDTQYTQTPIAWRSVKYFSNYWINKGYSDMAASNSNVYPGNPVYYLNSDGTGHVVICVGYNSAGIPIVNGHNRDVYHIPYTLATNSNRRTIQIVTSNELMNKPEYAYDFGIISSTQKSTVGDLYFVGEIDYYKFEVTSAGIYTMYSDYCGSSYLDTFGVLYKDSEPAPSGSTTLYMVEIASADDGGNGINFSISEYLTPGIYYIGVYSQSYSQTGPYYIYINK